MTHFVERCLYFCFFLSNLEDFLGTNVDIKRCYKDKFIE